MTKKTLTVNGMSCAHCQKAVESAVSSLPGVTDAQVDLEKKLLTVEFDPEKCSLEAISDAVTEEGFEVAS